LSLETIACAIVLFAGLPGSCAAILASVVLTRDGA
jgi:hypothetical protein